MDASKHVVDDEDMDASKHVPKPGSRTQVVFIDERRGEAGVGEIPSDAVLTTAPRLSEPADGPDDDTAGAKPPGAREASVSPATAETGTSPSSSTSASHTRSSPGADEPIPPPPSVRRIELTDLTQPMRVLGTGEFCTAFGTTLDGQPVVVKMLRPEQQSNSTAAADLLSEIHLMVSMSHPNVLGVIAMGHDPNGFPFLVLEKLSTVLSNELPKSAGSVPLWTRKSQCKRWPLLRALTAARDLAIAMHYCHHEAFPGYRILHRDLKPSNIGFLPDGRLVLFDFGLAKLWRISEGDDGTESRPLTGNTGSLRYMAPEVALSRPYSHKAEIFAFAVLLWQMWSHEVPFSDCDVKGFYRRVCHNGERPKLPSKGPDMLRALVEACWDPDPLKRPDTGEIIKRLNVIIDYESERKSSPMGRRRKK